MRNEKQIFIQSCLRLEGEISTETMGEEVKFNIKMYDCTEDFCNANTRTSTPEPIMQEICVAKEAILSYMKNNYGGK